MQWEMKLESKRILLYKKRLGCVPSQRPQEAFYIRVSGKFGAFRGISPTALGSSREDFFVCVFLK